MKTIVILTYIGLVLLICTVGFIGAVLGLITVDRWAARQLTDEQTEA